MPRKKSFAVIGLGKFGKSVIETLLQRKQNIYVFDNNEQRIQNLINVHNEVEGLIIDSTQKATLQEKGFDKFDSVIVAIGNMESSILTAINLIDLNVQNIFCKAADNRHMRILKAIGVKNIIQPDAISGRIAAFRSFYNIDFDIQPVDEEYVSTIIKVNEQAVDNKTIQELKMSNNKDYNIVYIKRKGKTILPEATTEIKLNDEIMFIAKNNIINEWFNRLTISETDLQKKEKEHE